VSSGGVLPAGLDGMMNNPAMKEAMAKVGGADGLADLMKNPQMMAMAQKMMKDPKVRNDALSKAVTPSIFSRAVWIVLESEAHTLPDSFNIVANYGLL
jgi:hypothetical protein